MQCMILLLCGGSIVMKLFHQIRHWWDWTKVVSIKLFMTPWLIFSYRFRWKSVIHHEPLFCSQVHWKFFGFVQGNVRNRALETNIRKNHGKLHIQEGFYWPYEGDSNIWYLAQLFCYSFLPFFSPKVWIAFHVGINARNYAALLYSNEDRAKWIFPFP